MKGRKRNKERIILGITGSFGSGKTIVAREFHSFGAKVINADKIAHKIVEPGTQIYKKTINVFGGVILKKNETINRDKLAKIVFNNKNSLNILNRIIHPEVIRIIKNQIKISPSKIIVLDAPLLIEAGLRKIVDKIVVVKISRKKQIQRIIKKTSLSKTDILKRIRHQMPLLDKIRLADFVIDNNGSIQETKKQVKNIWKKMNLSLAANK